MAKKQSSSGDDNVYRVKHISKAAWEEGSMSLPGLPMKDAQPPARSANADFLDLDVLDDDIVNMAFTQEISLDLIREYMHKEEEKSKQRQQEKKQRKAAPPYASTDFGPIRADEIEGYQKKETQTLPEPRIAKPRPAPPKTAKIEPKPKPWLQRPKAAKPAAEIAQEPAPGFPEPSTLLIPKAPETIAQELEHKPEVAPIFRAKAPTPAPEPEATLAMKETAPKAKAPKAKRQKIAKEPKQKAPQKAEAAKSKQQKIAKEPKAKPEKEKRLSPLVGVLKNYYRDAPQYQAEEGQSDFWDDEIPLYSLPLARILEDIYRNIYYFGLRFARPILLLARYALPYLLQPLLALWHLGRAVVLAVHHVTIARAKRRLAAGKAAHDRRLALRQKAGVQPKTGSALLEFAEDYSGVLKAAGNMLLPLAAAGVLLLVVGSVSRRTYALQVNYNNHNVGYISNESVYLSAQSAASQHIAPKPADTTSAAQDNVAETVKTYANYALVRVKPEQLTSADRLTDELLTKAPDPMTIACGVYVADESGENSRLIGTTRNSTDASWVLENLKAEKSKGLKLMQGATVGFVQQVDLVSGFYPESQLVEANSLLQKLNGNEKGGVSYALQEGDTLWTVAFRMKIPYDSLLAMNPELVGKETSLHPGDEIFISKEVPVLQLKVTQTERRTRPIPFETVNKDNATLFQGTTRVVTKGEPGEEEVFERVTYINNVAQKGAVPVGVPRRIKDPVTEVREIGRRSTTVTTSNGGTVRVNPSAMGFTWPVPQCHTITSPYGYRRSGFHRGMDIAGGRAYGQTVVAARDGTVSFVGYTSNGYGYQVVINHGGGVQTRYAHMINGSSPLRSGGRVSIGQPIGRIGTTGNTTGPHLHFEVIINGQTQNPAYYLKR